MRNIASFLINSVFTHRFEMCWKVNVKCYINLGGGAPQVHTCHLLLLYDLDKTELTVTVRSFTESSV